MASLDATPLGAVPEVPRRWRASAAALAVLLALPLLPLASAAPRYTLVNTGLRVDHTWTTLLASTGVALLLVAAAVLWRNRALRGVALVLALGAAVVALGLFTYRVEATPEALSVRALMGRTTMAWRDVTRVDQASSAIVVWGGSGASVHIDVSGFRGDQRASLERTIARRVAEARGDAGSTSGGPEGAPVLAPALR